MSQERNPGANLTIDQRALLTEIRNFLYESYLIHLHLRNDLGVPDPALDVVRKLLGRLNYQIGISIPPGTERYEFVVDYPGERLIFGAITNCESGVEASADHFFSLVHGKGLVFTVYPTGS